MNSEKRKAPTFYVVFDSKKNKQGLNKLYFRFLDGTRKKDYFTGIRWKSSLFDKINELLLPRFLGDPDYEKHNHTIKEIKNRLNKLSFDNYVKNRGYVIEDFINLIKNKNYYTDFPEFMKIQIRENQIKGIISYDTWRKQKSVLEKIKIFFGEKFTMSEISIEKIEEFEAFYRRKGMMRNTITSYHKVFAKYITIAQEKGLIEKNPYDKLKYRWVNGQRIVLSQNEVVKLYSSFSNNELPIIEHEVLRRFLFSCLTGLRISDTHRITDSNIVGNYIIFQPHKTKKTGKTIKIPLPEHARKLIADRKGLLFSKFTDQAINRILKRIALLVGVNPELSYHSARDTFGTIFIELGGDIKSLCDLMGHSSTKVTEIYLKMSDQRKNKLMSNFDKLF